MKSRTIFFILVIILGVWFLYIERAILTPFILAAIFAYIFNPVVNIFTNKLRLPRTVSIIIVYTVIIAIVVITGSILAKKIAEESIDISKVSNTLLESTRKQVSILPDWLVPAANDVLINLKRSRFLNFFGTPAALPIFSQAISRVISFFIFLFSGFYFLKDGEKFIGRCLSMIPAEYKKDIEVLLRKIYAVLGGYLRGEILLIVIVSVVLYIALSILGIRFALTLAIFSGIAEIVPVIGPITAGAVATLVVLITGTANFGLLPIQAALIVIAIYFIFRQLEDYLLIPHIMEKLTKLPPFIIFFAVIAGGHIAGVVGLILAVPTAAIVRLLLEYSLKKVS